MKILAELRYTSGTTFGSIFLRSDEIVTDLASEKSVYAAMKRQVLPETAQTYILSANLLRQLQ